MKSTTRVTLAAVVTGVAAAVGAAATPAAAVDAVPVAVPLDSVEKPLNMELPELGYEIPVPRPVKQEGSTGYAVGGFVPERTLPQPPVAYGLPGAWLTTPLPHVLGDGVDHVGVHLPASGLGAPASGLSVDIPLTGPEGDDPAQPHSSLPKVGILG
jgi:hypothetical protein